MEHLYSAIKLLLRRRISSQEHLHFEPILSLIDLTCLSLGPILGTGIFSILTYSSKYHAGPSSLLSFLIAAVASCLGGLCFTELATRFPNSGPSYSFIYMTLGELPSFLIAWSMLLEYAFCSALSMRSFVQYFQFLLSQTNNATGNGLNDQQKIPQTSLVPYLYDPYSSFRQDQEIIYLSNTHHLHHSKLNPVPENTKDDLQTSAFLILLFLIVFLLKSQGIKTACFVNNLFTFFALLLLIGLLLVCTIYFVRIEHWTSGPGFFANGIHGVFNGAGICFVSFIGFDIICSNVVNCKDVERSLPSSVSLSFLLGLISTFSCAVIYTLSVPVSMQDTFASFAQVAIAFNNDSIICMLGLGTLLNYAGSALAILLLRYDKLEKLPLDLERPNLLSSRNSINNSYSLNLQCSKCLNLNKFYSHSNKSALITCKKDSSPLYDHAVREPGLQLIVALPTSFYYRQYYKQTFDKIKKSWSDCHLQSRICSFPSTSYNQSRSSMQDKTQVPNSYSKQLNPMNEDVFYQRDATNLRSDQREEIINTFNSPQLTSCYVDKSYSSSLEFDSNLNYLDQLPNIDTEIRVKYILFTTILLMIGMGLCTSRNDQLLWFMSMVGIKPVYWPIELISCLFSAGIIYQLIRLSKQPIHQRKNEKNALPCLPLLPVFALWMQLHLALCLSLSAWVTFIIWSLIGFFVYMSFSIWNSKEGGSSFNIEEELESRNALEETEHILDEEYETDELSSD